MIQEVVVAGARQFFLVGLGGARAVGVVATLRRTCVASTGSTVLL